MRHEKIASLSVKAGHGRAFGFNVGWLEIPVKHWQWKGFDDPYWDKNYAIFSNRENYSIWPSTFVEMSIFPLLVVWLSRHGQVTLVGKDRALGGICSRYAGISMSLDMVGDPLRVDRARSVEWGDVFVLGSATPASAIAAQNVQISDEYVSIDFYVNSPSTRWSDRPPFLGGKAEYWGTCLERYPLLGTYYMPASEDEVGRIVFMSASVGNVQAACLFVERAFAELQVMKMDAEKTISGESFLDHVDDLLRMLPSECANLQSL